MPFYTAYNSGNINPVIKLKLLIYYYIYIKQLISKGLSGIYIEHKNIIRIATAYLPFITAIITKTFFSFLYLMCSGYIIYLGFIRLIGYILQVIAPEYYIEEAGTGIGLKRVAVI